MYYRKRKMSADHENYHKKDEANNLSHQFCFVHRIADLPLVSASIEQILHYYEKTKKSNRLLNASLHLAENSVKFAVGKAEPFRKLLDGPIVASNKIACQQLEKLEERYPIILTTPDELLRSGKSYYEKSYVKTGIDTAYSVVLFGDGKVRGSKKLASDVVGGILCLGKMKFGDIVRLGVLAVNETLTYSDSIVDAYIAPPNSSQNGPAIVVEPNNSVVSRVYHISSKMVNGLKYRAGCGLELSREQAHLALSQMQSVFFLLDYAKNTTYWMTDDAIAKLSAAQAQAATLLREMKIRTEKYGKQPDVALLVLVQNVTSVLVTVSDYVHKYSSPYLPENVHKNVVLAVQYAHELGEMFNKATSLGELKEEMIKEARDKFAFVHSIFSSMIDRVVVFPPISWLVTVSRTTNGIVNKNFSNGGVVDGVKERFKNEVQ